ncbi:MAG: ABC transporter ATP-binding protein, partial [Myxococcota bacterium]
MAAIELNRVTKRFGRVEAVKNLTLSVPEGSLFGLIGPNGAGKTTTFGLLSGFLQPTEGQVFVRGQQLRPGRPPVGQVLALPQDAGLPGRQRVAGCLVHLGRLGGLSAADARVSAARALERVGLADLAERRVNQLSHGQRRRVGIASTLVGRDEVIVLDEPTAGLDPRTALELRSLIKELHADRTVVLSSHDLG